MSNAAETAREQVVELLKAAGFTQHEPSSRRRRRSGPEPADGFRVFWQHGSDSILAAWVPSAGGDGKSPVQVARSREMAGAYAEAARAAGWAASTGGITWQHARLAKEARP